MLADRWKQILRQPGALPALPEVLLRLQAGLYELNLDIDEMCQELQRDPALVAEILKLINCPLFAMSRRVESLRQAVVMLGMRRVRAVILSQSLRQSLASYQSPAFKLFKWWDRSLLNAVTAAATCRRSSPECAEEAYLAGLVVDLGVLILSRYEPAYQDLLRQLGGNASGEDLCRQCRKMLGMDHAELAAEVFADWKFPAQVVTAIRRHHDTALFDEPDVQFLPRAICFASLVTDCVVTQSQELCGRLLSIARNKLFISPPELRGLISASLSHYQALAAPLGFGSLAGQNMPAALASA